MWNNRKGRTLKVGSILLLQENVTQQARSLRLTELLLLMLRCLLIILLAFLLARPVWKSNLTSANEKGWLLIEKQDIQETYKNFKPAIDSLLSAGFKFHYFNSGFKAAKLEDALKNTEVTQNEKDNSYWALLKQLNEQVPADLPVYLFTNNQLNKFEGTRPEVSMNLQWSTYSSEDTIANVLAAVYKTGADSLRVIKAMGKPTATLYTSENIPGGENSAYKLIHDNGKTLMTLTSDTNTKVEVDTSRLDITIYTDVLNIEANYLKAAIEAIRHYTQRKINVSIVNDPQAIKGEDDWLFWLSEKNLPAQPLPARIFAYAKGKQEVINSWIQPTNNFAVNDEVISLAKVIRNTALANGFEKIWQDGFGNAVLRVEKTTPLVYRFSSRFNPEWNDLVWSPRFVEMMFDLLILPGADIKNFDKRMIDITQYQPYIAAETKAFDKEKFVQITDLTKLFWLIAFVIFCSERYLSLISQKQ